MLLYLTRSYYNSLFVALILGVAFSFACLGSFGCNFVEVKDGKIGEEIYNGPSGLLRGGEDCSFYDKEVIDDGIWYQISNFTAWGGPIFMFTGAFFAILNATCLNYMHIFILMSTFFGNICFWTSFTVFQSELW